MLSVLLQTYLIFTVLHWERKADVMHITLELVEGDVIMSSIFLMLSLNSIQTCYKNNTPSTQAIVASLFIPWRAHAAGFTWPCPPLTLWDSVCSCPPFTFHQLGGKHWWGHRNIASVGTSALYLSLTLIYIRLKEQCIVHVGETSN